jgi:hypothetical protein
MLTFIASLKFYAKLWPRAYIFSKLASIIGRSALPGTFKNTAIDEHDVFTQQYFIWLFKLLISSKDLVKDFHDGTSYVAKADATGIANSALFFLSGTDHAKLEVKMSKEFKTVTKPNTKNFEGIDADVLLSMILEEYVDCRSRLLKNLKAKYFKQPIRKKIAIG